MEIAFISYPVLDLGKAVEFYQKALGIEPLFHTNDWAEFKLNEQRFALQKANKMNAGHNGTLVYFMAKPMKVYIERLESIGAKLLNPPEIHSYGKLAQCQDPEGNVFGLYEPPIR